MKRNLLGVLCVVSCLVAGCEEPAYDGDCYGNAACEDSRDNEDGGGCAAAAGTKATNGVGVLLAVAATLIIAARRRRTVLAGLLVPVVIAVTLVGCDKGRPPMAGGWYLQTDPDMLWLDLDILRKHYDNGEYRTWIVTIGTDRRDAFMPQKVVSCAALNSYIETVLGANSNKRLLTYVVYEQKPAFMMLDRQRSGCVALRVHDDRDRTKWDVIRLPDDPTAGDLQ